MATLSRLARVPAGEVRMLGKDRVPILAKAGIRTIADLLHFVPRTYIDRSHTPPISTTPIGEEVTVVGTIQAVSSRRARKGLLLVEARVADGSASVRAVWFNQPFRARQLGEGMEVALSGVVERFRGGLQMKTPTVEILGDPKESIHTGRVVPVYTEVGGIKAGVLRRAVHNALLRARPIPDPLPEVMLAEHGLMSRDEAYADIHFPETLERVAPARRRLVFDEFFRLELALALQKRRQIEQASGIAHRPTGELSNRFLDGLPYRLTGAQTRVLEEIRTDLEESHPMHRLLQGEVGSGKTVVAVATLLLGVEGGWQGAMMAPTEVLAGQHYLGVVDLLAQAGLSPSPFAAPSQLGMDSLFRHEEPAVHVALLTGSTARANYREDVSRELLLEDIASGRVDVVVGTHALIQEGVHFHRLGVAVVDEQHRFGVAQRVKLKEKADAVDPDLVIMTATPIPRTLAMTMYGDLDVSLLDEMPPGRNPVRTVHLPRAEEARAWRKVGEEAGGGRQAFVVCPLVEDSPKLEAASATAEHQRLSGLLPELRVGLIHGQMRPGEKEAVMGSLRAGDIDVLVSTTVIEVGIDVPNATVMVVEDADRFGLSQLHQLRGRVGRGDHPGTCILLADPGTPEAERRIAAMVSSNDGFRLAEEDLAIRGQGTVFGTRQAGLADLRLGNVITDFDLLLAARSEAFRMVDHDPGLDSTPELAEEIRAMMGDRVDWLFVS